MKTIHFTSFILFIFLCFTVACSKGDDMDDDIKEPDPDTFVNDLNVTVSGEKNGTYHITGEDVAIGCYGLRDNKLNLFTIGFGNDDITLTSGIFTFDPTKKEEQDGVAAYAHYGDKWQDKYGSMYYRLYFETENAETQDYARMNITLFETKADEKLNALVHVHLTGTFHYKASNTPDVMPTAAIEDMWRRNTLPPYLPELAGTSKIEVRGSFDIMFTTTK